MADIRYSPREAAITIVNYVNHRNANVALLALNVYSISPPVLEGFFR
jgi:hypothetical protein